MLDIAPLQHETDAQLSRQRVGRVFTPRTDDGHAEPGIEPLLPELLAQARSHLTQALHVAILAHMPLLVDREEAE